MPDSNLPSPLVETNTVSPLSTNSAPQPKTMDWSKVAAKKKKPGSGVAKWSLKTKMKAPDLRLSEADGQIKHLVLDAGAFISRKPFYESLQADVKYWTTSAVLKEIRDRQSRKFIDSFPYKLQTKEVSQEALKFAKEFCNLTKDLANLSGPDLEIVALGYMVEREVHGMTNINPIPLQRDFQKEVVEKHNARTSIKRNSNVPLVQRKPVKPLVMDEFFNQEPPPQSHGGSQEIAKKKKRKPKPKEEEDKPDSADDGIPWITEDNIHLLSESSMMIMKKDKRDKNRSTVGVITTDYQIQNALYQIGIRILSVNGMSIYQIRQWALHCYACFKMEKDTNKRFCSACGNTTLQRVSIFMNARGKVKYRFCNRNRSRKKGLIHPIPYPKGGRAPPTYIHTEDVYLKELKKAKRKSKFWKKDDCDLDFGGNRWNAMDLPKVKAGTNDPNRPRPGSRDKNRRRRRRR